MPQHLDHRSSLRAEHRIPAKHRVIASTTAMSMCLFGMLLLTGDEVGGQTFDYHQIRGRLPSQSDIEVHEGESDLTKSGTSRFQSLAPFGPHWSQGAHLLWDGAVGDIFTTDFFVEEAGIYDVKIQFRSRQTMDGSAWIWKTSPSQRSWVQTQRRNPTTSK